MFTVRVPPHGHATKLGGGGPGRITRPTVHLLGVQSSTERLYQTIDRNTRKPERQRQRKAQLCRGEEGRIQMTAVTSAAVTTVAENWQRKHVVLHHNHRHWEMHRESGRPRCPLASTNEISKIGMTRATKRKKEDQKNNNDNNNPINKQQQQQKTQN